MKLTIHRGKAKEVLELPTAVTLTLQYPDPEEPGQTKGVMLNSLEHGLVDKVVLSGERPAEPEPEAPIEYEERELTVAGLFGHRHVHEPDRVLTTLRVRK